MKNKARKTENSLIPKDSSFGLRNLEPFSFVANWETLKAKAIAIKGEYNEKVKLCPDKKFPIK